MRSSNPSERLKQLMSERKLKQVEILERSLPYQKELGIKMGKSTLSQYVNGVQSPDQHRIYLLSKTLDVSEPWLMGYDVDRERIPDNERKVTAVNDFVLVYEKLELSRKEKVLDFAKAQLEEQEKTKVTSIFDKFQSEDNDDYVTDFVKGVVAAGHGAFQEDELYMEVKLRTEDVPESYDTIATVVGDSMEPLIHNNDLLFIEITSQVEPNSIGIFRVNGKNFVKKLKRDYDGSYYLQSLNNSYEEIYLTEDDDIRTIGEVVDIYREN